MKNINDKNLIKKSIEKINKLADKIDRELKIMHVCGSHEHTICKYGIRDILPKNISVIPGPGCPVCVTTQKEIDSAIYLCEKGYTICTLGDMYRVPGSKKSLMDLQSEGGDVKIVYGISDSVKLSKKGKDVVFISIGFETTAPTTGSELISLKNKDISNFHILNCHRQTPPVMDFLLSEGDVPIDGFICPGHVSTITGLKPYYEPCNKYKKPMVVAGFEPIDVLLSILMILRQIYLNKYSVENEYIRAVRNEGNPIAQKIINEVFQPVDIPWRGFPTIPNGGLELKEKYKTYDIWSVEDKPNIKETINKNCICGDILRGKKLPTDCKLFGTVCTPLNPIGSCMVSEEGTCSIFFKFNRRGNLSFNF